MDIAKEYLDTINQWREMNGLCRYRYYYRYSSGVHRIHGKDTEPIRDTSMGNSPDNSGNTKDVRKD